MERLVAGKLDAFFLIAGYPAKVVQWAGEQTAISLVPITGEPTAVLVRLNPFLRRDSIPAGVYPGVGEVATLTAPAQWITREDIGAATISGRPQALSPRSAPPLLARRPIQCRPTHLENQ